MPLTESPIHLPGNVQGELLRAVTSGTFRQVEQRIIRQLAEAVLYEEILPDERKGEESERSVRTFELAGYAEGDERVSFRMAGRRMESFGRVRLLKQPVVRVSADGREEPATIEAFSKEVLGRTKGRCLPRFAAELEQTLLKDLQAHGDRTGEPLSGDERRYDELEGRLIDGHPYHPCYKSRIGFTLADNLKYGPEYRRELRPVWLAVRRDRCRLSVSASIREDDFLKEQLGEAAYARFQTAVAERQLAWEEFRPIPVHPWQWENVILPRFYRDLADGTILHLGEADDAYRAQQSIRTLANVSDPGKAYLKLPLHITNTSTSRLLAEHTVMNGPRITDWLHGLMENDPVARKLDVILLREVLGIAYGASALPEDRQAAAYGALGAVFRESLHRYLRPGEEAVPLYGLTFVEPNGVPLIEPWIRRHGTENWIRALLEAAVTPVVHMLYAHGIGMESHGQNIIIVHEDGLPVRIALKDFHDGVRFSPAHLAEPDKRPELQDVPASHTAINRNSFILTDRPDDVRDFTYDAFFFIAMTELAMFADEYYGFPESRFWAITAEIILDYREANPQHHERYACFDLFARTVRIEEMTKRRLYGDGEPHFKDGLNPLYPYRRRPC